MKSPFLAFGLWALTIRLTKQRLGGQGSARGFGTRVTLLGIVSVQWWLRFGRCCLQSADSGFESGIDGAPGLRPHDRVKYYAAFVIDPDGNRIEAVTFPQG